MAIWNKTSRQTNTLCTLICTPVANSPMLIRMEWIVCWEWKTAVCFIAWLKKHLIRYKSIARESFAGCSIFYDRKTYMRTTRSIARNASVNKRETERKHLHWSKLSPKRRGTKPWNETISTAFYVVASSFIDRMLLENLFSTERMCGSTIFDDFVSGHNFLHVLFRSDAKHFHQ